VASGHNCLNTTNDEPLFAPTSQIIGLVDCIKLFNEEFFVNFELYSEVRCSEVDMFLEEDFVNVNAKRHLRIPTGENSADFLLEIFGNLLPWIHYSLSHERNLRMVTSQS